MNFQEKGTLLFHRIRNGLLKARLSNLARQVAQDRLTYLPPEKLIRIETYARLATADDVPGNLLEFGVALGGSAIILAAQAARRKRLFFGFDVFAMIPPPTSEKDDDKSRERYRIIASGQSEGIGGDTYYGYRDNLIDDVRRSFAKYGLPIDGKSRFLCKGLFEETFPKYDGMVAFAHIDCDWYAPVSYCLNHISRRLSAGGVIVLDDYHDYGGARTATDEFVKQNPEFELIAGPNVILRKRR
ncbi:TylF/MycF/NovP-related O-methyltransferase [Bradyrhizobium sp. LLZ17]|uniref:TylF/MycF/NovP-related O-methyltransferase n=1 Tax=Bradyrhizobium sp. LLZ17 TaxID=3239388 RepID=A0AB39XTY0_9BRAD